MGSEASPFAMHNGRIHSPFFIFIRASHRLEDENILQALGIEAVRHCSGEKDTENPRIFITEDHAWKHVADDWRYSLWHRRTAVDTLHKVLPEASIFACSVGDCDYSFDFKYYDGGRLRRSLEVTDPNFDKKRIEVTKDIGQPLPREKALDNIENEQEYLLSLAEALGVKVRHRADAVRCYAYDKPTSISKWLGSK